MVAKYTSTVNDHFGSLCRSPNSQKLLERYGNVEFAIGGYYWNNIDQNGWIEERPEDNCYTAGHAPVENGCRKSYCKRCDVEMFFDMSKGWYVKE